MTYVDLGTTNLLLGIIAGVSVLLALVLIGAGIMGWRAYNSLLTTVRELEARQIAPLVAKVTEILADVKGVTGRVSEQTERVDHAIRGTMDRVDETAERVKENVRSQAHRAAGVVAGVRDAIAHVLARRRVVNS